MEETLLEYRAAVIEIRGVLAPGLTAESLDQFVRDIAERRPDRRVDRVSQPPRPRRSLGRPLA